MGLAIREPLRELDVVAYLRFASVYRSFESLDDFEARGTGSIHQPLGGLVMLDNLKLLAAVLVLTVLAMFAPDILLARAVLGLVDWLLGSARRREVG